MIFDDCTIIKLFLIARWITSGAFRILMQKYIQCMNVERGIIGLIDENLEYNSPEWHTATDKMPWVIIWMDGQTTHHDKESMETARRNKVIMGTFIPHTTHHCQPLDRNLNTAIKVSNFFFNNDNRNRNMQTAYGRYAGETTCLAKTGSLKWKPHVKLYLMCLMQAIEESLNPAAVKHGITLLS
jgi:hypothetical protein